MIILNLTDKDPNSLRVIDWLNYWGVEFQIIRESDNRYFTKLSIDNSDVSIVINDNFRLDNNIYWNRRGTLSNLGFVNESAAGYMVHNELNKIKEFTRFLISFSSLSKEEDNDANKLVTLFMAAKLGIKIPRTLITTEKKDVESFFRECTRVIVKPIDKIVDEEIKRALGLKNPVNILDVTDLEKLPALFGPIKVQEYIEKEFEIRTFILGDIVKSAAIFSQGDETTQIDYRNYNNDKPNRVVPFKLPKFFEIKLRRLMKMLKYDTGSIDIVFSKRKEYVFLEINPVGNFSQISLPTNFELEQDIARNLINRNEKNHKTKEGKPSIFSVL